LAFSLILLFLGYNDITLFLKNKTPQIIDVKELLSGKPHKKRLIIKNGYLDLKNAISTSGSIEIDALLVPLTDKPGKQPYKIFVETRDENIVKLVTTYNFDFDTEYQREQFYKKHEKEFYPKKDIGGMMFSQLIANTNQTKLLKLVEQVGLKVKKPVFFFSENKTPPKYRGFFFMIVGIAGLIKSLTMLKNK
jgi:hypothetical protein